MSFFRRYTPTFHAAVQAILSLPGAKIVSAVDIHKPDWVRNSGRQLASAVEEVGTCYAHSYRNPRRATAAQIKRRARKRRNQLRHKAHVQRRRK